MPIVLGGALPLWSPVLGVVTSPYNLARIHPVTKVKMPHLGTDFVAPTGREVRALANGVVVATAKHAPGDTSLNGVLPGRTGSCVLVDHGGGLRSYYGHTGPLIGPGQKVKGGQVIGRSDGSGNITGPHLHLEVHVNGTAVDPEPWSEARGLDIGITDTTSTEEDVALTPEQEKALASIPDIQAKVADLVASKNDVVQPALARIDARTAKMLTDGLPVDKIVAGVLAGIPAGGGADPKVIADAVRAELSQALVS